jgi:CRP/FNR family cyclic AMP-dependent transcriptional regulator
VPLNLAQQAAVMALFDPTSWFVSLPDPVRQAFFRRATIRHIEKGDVLTIQGTPLDGLGIVVEGNVDWLREFGDRQESLMYVAGPGSWFGLGNVLANRPVVTATARTDGRVVLLTRPQFEDLVREHPRFYRDLTAVMVGLLDATLGLLAESRALASESRACAHLATFAELRAQEAGLGRGEPLVLPLSQTELARMVGVSRQRLNPVLARLGALGLLTTRFREVVVHDIDKLRAHAIACLPPAVADAPSGRPRRRVRQSDEG